MKHLRLVVLVLAATAWASCAAFAGSDCCSKSSAASAKSASCPMHASMSASGACPSTPSCPAGSPQCAKGGKTVKAASASGCCAGKAAMAASGSSCGMKPASAGAAHMNCTVCDDEATCETALRSANVRSQVVELRNGAMIVYTADTPENVRSLQATVARFHDHIMGALSGSDASLCGGCRSFRGALASGKFARELVNVKNGCQVLYTSSDRAMVEKIHEMTGAPTAARTRS